ncbi:membrane bound hydrogenase subunit mbhJ [Longilinea arvoryzae]|uniref:Membrane bound hydrogenase subunit mbhJ n=2 Tax=Longilinea arvoryzae TaxID=360412 RepID=A0A0S7BIF3_9CHLR|nr:membrane bound hydrogenase subunit mbhJ [Longilinea arvoryzae]
MNPYEKLMQIARGKSPWVYCVNTGACNGCDIEVAAGLTPRFDAEQLGVVRQGSPKHADILIISGPVTLRTRDALLDIYNQMPNPKAVVAVGSCPASGNIFAGSPTVYGAVDQFIPVDVYVAGCPPRPQAILQGIAEAAELLASGKQKNRKEVKE